MAVVGRSLLMPYKIRPAGLVDPLLVVVDYPTNEVSASERVCDVDRAERVTDVVVL